MSDLIMQLSDVMQAEVRSLDHVAHNAANLATPGFRSERAVLSNDFLSRVKSAEPVTAQQSVSLKDGSVSISNVATDLALRGNGWFVVEGGTGPMLTRDGRFQLSADGTLVTRNGYPVLGEDGAISGLDSTMRVSADGSITLNGAVVAKLKLVTPANPAALHAIGEGLYRHDGKFAPATGAVVVQGAYENSNVDTAADMMLLMRTTRHIETLQRSMSAYDQLLNTGINQLGK